MNNVLHFFEYVALLCLPTFALAQDIEHYFEVGGIGYNILSERDHTVEVAPLRCAYYNGSFNIPPTVAHDGETYDVVALGERAFEGARLSGITIPSSVTRIKEGCFLFAQGLTSIAVPASVTEIEQVAFAVHGLTAINVDANNPNYRTIDGMLFSKDTSTIVECPMAKSGSISLPQCTKHIGAVAFGYCSGINRITLPEGLSSIGYWAFVANQRLNNIVIPASVSRIDASPFVNCPALTNLTIAEGNTHYYLDGMFIYSAGGDSLISAHKSADSLHLPNTLRVINGFGGNSDIKYVHVPDGATTIGTEAFSGSSLASIDLPSHMELIDDWAFNYCESLTHVGMPQTLGAMGKGCFQKCTKLTSANIPNGLRAIPPEAFIFCSALSHVTWGNDVETIDTLAFAGCKIKDFRFPPALRNIKLAAFTQYEYDAEALNSIVFSAPLDTLEPESFTNRHIRTLRFRNSTPPAGFANPEMGDDYGCLTLSVVDSIIIPCGSLNAWLAERYWRPFASKFHEDCSSIDNVAEGGLSVYPNPATDRLTILTPPEYSSVEIANSLGQTLLCRKIAGGTAEIDVSGLARGIYFVRLKSTNSAVAKKVMLQ